VTLKVAMGKTRLIVLFGEVEFMGIDWLMLARINDVKTDVNPMTMLSCSVVSRFWCFFTSKLCILG